MTRRRSRAALGVAVTADALAVTALVIAGAAAPAAQLAALWIAAGALTALVSVALVIDARIRSRERRGR